MNYLYKTNQAPAVKLCWIHLKHREYSSYSVIALSCLFSVDLMVQIKPVLRPAWFSLGDEFSPDEHLRRIPPLPYPFNFYACHVSYSWSLDDLLSSEQRSLVVLAINNDLLFLSKISRDSHHQVNNWRRPLNHSPNCILLIQPYITSLIEGFGTKVCLRFFDFGFHGLWINNIVWIL